MKDAKKVVGFNHYWVTKNGELYSTKSGEPSKIKGSLCRGYITVKLSDGDRVRNVLMHRLVAEMFLPKQRGKNIVNHIDGVKTNNKVSNLEWTDHRGNMDHYKEKLAPTYRVKKLKAKQDLVNSKQMIVNLGYEVYKEYPDEFIKLFGATYDLK